MITANAPDRRPISDAGATITSTMSDYPGMKKIIAEYVQGLPEDVCKMRDLLNRGDMQSLRRVVHQLRGTGGGYGFDLISDLAAHVEDAINAADHRASVAVGINELIGAIRRIEGFDQCAAIPQDTGGTL